MSRVVLRVATREAGLGCGRRTDEFGSPPRVSASRERCHPRSGGCLGPGLGRRDRHRAIESNGGQLGRPWNTAPATSARRSKSAGSRRASLRQARPGARVPRRATPSARTCRRSASCLRGRRQARSRRSRVTPGCAAACTSSFSTRSIAPAGRRTLAPAPSSPCSTTRSSRATGAWPQCRRRERGDDGGGEARAPGAADGDDVRRRPRLSPAEQQRRKRIVGASRDARQFVRAGFREVQNIQNEGWLTSRRGCPRIIMTHEEVPRRAAIGRDAGGADAHRRGRRAARARAHTRQLEAGHRGERRVAAQADGLMPAARWTRANVLQACVANGATVLYLLLVQRGAEINGQDEKSGMTALMTAAEVAPVGFSGGSEPARPSTSGRHRDPDRARCGWRLTNKQGHVRTPSTERWFATTAT